MKLLFLIIFFCFSAQAQRRQYFNATQYRFGNSAWPVLTSAEMSNISTVTSNVQTQIDLAPKGRTSYDASIIQGKIVPLWDFALQNKTVTFNHPVGTFPTSSIEGFSYSPDGRFLVIMSSDTPFARFYEVTQAGFGRIADPATIMPGVSRAASWSPDGRFVAIVSDTTPFLRIYERGKDNTTFTAVTSPTLAGAGFRVSWHPDNRFLVIGETDRLEVLQRTLSNTFAVSSTVTSGGGHPTGLTYTMAFSPDGKWLTLANPSGTMAHFSFNQSTGAVTRLADPATLPAPGQLPNWICYAPDSSRLVVVGETGLLMPYSVNQSTGLLTKTSDPDVMPGAFDSVPSCAFHPNGKLLVVVTRASPNYILFYNHSSGVFTKNANPTFTYPNTPIYSAFSPDGKYLLLTYASGTPLAAGYETSATAPVIINRSPLIKSATPYSMAPWY